MRQVHHTWQSNSLDLDGMKKEEWTGKKTEEPNVEIVIWRGS